VGIIVHTPTRNYGDFKVTHFGDMTEKILPFFEKYPLQGNKLLDLSDFCKVAGIIKVKSHLTQSGLEQICQIKSGMNRGRD
jgi:hypothetical protein